MLAVLLFVIASFGVGFAAVVYRADPTRLDNRLFAYVSGMDAATALVRGLLVFQGHALSDTIVMRWNTALQGIITALIVEFAYSFPFTRPMPRWARAVNVVAFATVIPFVFAPPAVGRLVSLTYFTPVMVVTLVLLARNYRRVRGADATAVRLVIGALVLRWLTAQFCYEFAYGLGVETFNTALTCEATAAVLASQVLIGYAVVVGHLFRVRGFLAEVLVIGSCALAVSAATVAGIEAALAWAPNPMWLRLGLLGAALLPLGLTTAARHFRGKLENALLGPLDPRRAAREGCLEEYMHKAEKAAFPALLELAAEALGHITVGGTARFVALAGRPIDGGAGVLDESLAVAFAAPERTYIHCLALTGLDPAAASAFRAAGLHIAAPVRVQGELAGALVAVGGEVDRDSVLMAVTLAKHVGLRLENQTLVTQLEESKRLAALGAFAAAIAHDIRTPLTSVQMNVQILRGKAKLPPDDMEHFDIALDELRRLNTHISDLLDYAKPVRLAPVPHEPRELMDDAARTIGPALAERDIRIDVEDEAAPAVLADGPRIRQVLLNLLDNAARASTRGSAVTLRTATAPDGRVALEVRDRGKGIEAADLARIFEPFFTTRPDGTGLGLAIVQKLVRAHQGEVTVRSTPGQGATFTVLLPQAAGHVS